MQTPGAMLKLALLLYRQQWADARCLLLGPPRTPLRIRHPTFPSPRKAPLDARLTAAHLNTNCHVREHTPTDEVWFFSLNFQLKNRLHYNKWLEDETMWQRRR
jgi:hypothetical protein